MGRSETLHVHHSGAPIVAHGRAALRELGDAAIAHQTGCLVGLPGRPRTIGLGCLFRLHHLSPFKSGGSGRRCSPDTPPPINQLSQGGGRRCSPDTSPPINKISNRSIGPPAVSARSPQATHACASKAPGTFVPPFHVPPMTSRAASPLRRRSRHKTRARARHVVPTRWWRAAASTRAATRSGVAVSARRLLAVSLSAQSRSLRKGTRQSARGATAGV